VKRPTKRVRLAAALREAMEPLMRAHGFDHPPKSARTWSNRHPRADYWFRWVGEERQVIQTYWDKWSAPKFGLSWWDDENNRARGRLVTFSLQSWRLGPLSPTIRGESFGGLWPVPFAVRLAMKRLDALLAHWEDGAASPYLGLDAPLKHYVSLEELEPYLRDGRP
jgi:hypothetical protein